MTRKVEDFFITPLEAHFESVPTEGVRDTILEDMEQYTADDLNKAVEWLKRARQSQKTFPSPKECLRAIRSVTGSKQDLPVFMGNAINGSNYGKNAHAYAIQRGAETGKASMPVIDKDTQEWDEWLQYFAFIGATIWIYELQGRSKWTVPTRFPSQFDSRFVPNHSAKRKAA